MPVDPTARSDAAEVLDAWMRLWRRISPASEVSLTALSTLARLSGSGPLRLTVLAELEAVSQPAMTGLIGRLEASGLVVRTADPADGRAVLLRLTAAGQRLVDDRRAGRVAAIDELLELLDPAELDAVLAAVPALGRIIQHVTDGTTS